MKRMPCPLNGLRNISEFVYGGEVTAEPDPANCADRTWTDFLFMENNEAGVVREWWYHVPSALWFIVERDTRTDVIIRTYPASALFAVREDGDGA